VIEPEDGHWTDTGTRTARVVRAVNHPALGVNWDPCNALLAGEIPYPDGYAALRGLVRHVHFKDVLRHTAGPEFVTEGEIDWRGQLAALAADGYQGCISVETHRRPKIAAAKEGFDFLKQVLSA
jgi:sugar phosphate isomerase/epimerase